MTRKKPLSPDAPILHENHRRPVSRRDFLAQGLITGTGILAAPTLMGFLRTPEARAQAADCGIGVGGAGMIPFLALDLAGGVNVAGSNVLVGGPGGQMDFLSEEGYSKLGLPADMTPMQPGQIDTELGLAFHADSAFLAGIRSKTSATTRSRINGAVFCARSENDTQNNPHNPMYGINKAGANGDLVALIGSRNSESGGRSQAPMSMIDPSVRPTKVDRSQDARGLVDTGQLADLLEPQEAAALMSSMETLSDVKISKLNEQQAVTQLIHCGYAQTTDLIARFGDPNVLDPTLDTDIVGQAGSIFTADELNSSRFRKTAAVMKLTVEGFAGAGTIENGGYDYHDSTRATGEIRDFLAGQMMGAALEFAARRSQPLMLYVLSDGSVFSDGNLDDTAEGRGKGIWRGDRSSTAAVFFLVYNPNGRPQLAGANSNQIGHFRASGDVETAATRIANNVPLLAEAIVLNYMALHDDVGRFAQVFPDHGLGQAADLDSLIALQPIRSQT
jgi:hypothetical protein